MTKKIKEMMASAASTLQSETVMPPEGNAARGVLKCALREGSDANPSEGEMGLRRPEAGCILSATRACPDDGMPRSKSEPERKMADNIVNFVLSIRIVKFMVSKAYMTL